jgi:hypothetical protein
VQGRQITISDTASRVAAWDKSIVSKRLGRSSVAHAPKSGESGTLSATHPRRGAGHPRAARSMHESSEPDGTHLDVGSDRCCGHAIEAFLCLHRPETSRGSAAIRSSGLQHRRRLPKWPPGPALIAGYPHPVTNGGRPGAILNEDLTLSWFASPAAPVPSSWCSAWHWLWDTPPGSYGRAGAGRQYSILTPFFRTAWRHSIAERHGDGLVPRFPHPAGEETG